MSLEWADLRSQDGARESFEELICQLASCEKLDGSDIFIRRGKPDAGLECYWKLVDGTFVGWQAKFFRSSPSPTQWSQIDSSVKTAIEKNPELSKLIISLPIDRADKRNEDQRSFQEKWDDRVNNKWKDWATENEIEVEFEFWGNHEIFLRLSHDEHKGRHFFWFHREFFTTTGYKEKYEENVVVVGPRYTPELNVELPISTIFDGLGRTRNFYTKIRQLYGELFLSFRKINRRLEIDEINRYKLTILSDLPQLLTYLEKIQECEIEHILWEKIYEMSSELISIIQECIRILYDIKPDYSDPETEKKYPNYSVEFTITDLTKLLSSLEHVNSFSNSASAKLSNTPVLLLVGKAGTGKTHLFCDVAKNRIENRLPTILLLGQHFTESDPWRQILDNLSLSCTRDEFLGALEASAQIQGQKALVLIDALNEGSGKVLWRNHISRIITTLSRFKWISLALSVRTSYEPIVIPEGLTTDLYIRYEHHGFRDVEFDAIKSFFEFYNIALPTFPIIISEFHNPLFLQKFCEGINNFGLNKIPPNLQGLSNVFSFYIDSINHKLHFPEVLDFDQKDKLVSEVLNELAEEMAKKGVDWLPYEVAKKVVDAHLPSRGFETSLFRQLISEGLITQDMRRNEEDELITTIHFGYEKFSDYLISKKMLSMHLDPSDINESFKPGNPLALLFQDEYSCYRNSGIIESMIILLPETIDKEFFDIIPKEKIFEPMIYFLIDSLIWRNPENITNRTRELLAEYIEDKRQYDHFLNILILVGPNPVHPLNANYLHKMLIEEPIATRDSWWSIFLHDNYEKNTSIDRLISWAWFQSKNQLSDESTLLAGTLLSWFFTTSNRFIRDKATKALVSLFTPRLHLFIPLLEKFKEINDMYVLERIFAASYACSTRNNNVKIIHELALYIYTHVFEAGTPIPHILLRDYARGVIEYALYLDRSLDIDIEKIHPPYTSDWIEEPPTLDELYSLYSFNRQLSYEERPPEKRPIGTLFLSLGYMGDFSRYVIGEPNFFKWSNIPISDTQTEYDAKKHNFDTNIINCWILNRVLSLGWSPELFGLFDYFRDRFDNRASRSPHKAERIGKKYQWVALHEILARISDNFRFKGDSFSSVNTYIGSWQLHKRDIDPSNLLRKKYSEFEDSITTWWSPIVYDITDVGMNNSEWINSEDDLPEFQASLKITKPGTNNEYLVFFNQLHYIEPGPPGEEIFETPRREFYWINRAFLVKKNEMQQLLEAIDEQISIRNTHTNLRDLYGIFYGELFWSSAYHDITSELVDYTDWNKILHNCPIQVLTTCDNYLCESGGYDCSIDESITIKIPSKWLAEKMHLKWNGIEGQHIDSSGEIVTFDPSVFEPGRGAFLIKKDTIQEFINANDLAIVWIIVGEKRILDTSRIGEITESMKFNAIYYYDDVNNINNYTKYIRVDTT